MSYSKGRGNLPNRAFYRANAGFQLTPRLELEINGEYEDSPEHSGHFRLRDPDLRNSASVRPRRAEYDSRYKRGRLAYTTFHGQDVGQWDLSLDANHGEAGGDFNAVGNYTLERALLGLTHFTTWDERFAGITDQRTSAARRFLAGLRRRPPRPGAADPQWLRHHRAALAARTRGSWWSIQPRKATSPRPGALGPAVIPDLSAYSEREVYVEPIDMPVGYDIGSGAYRFEAPYRAGYRIIVGSDYWLTASGRLLRIDGSPLTYAGGEAQDWRTPTTPQ